MTLLKESYLLLANVYGFLTHPYLTLKKMSRDGSQLTIFTALWAGSSFVLFVLIGGFAFVIPRFLPQFKGLAKFGLGASLMGTIVLLLITVYLSYWLIFYFKKAKSVG